jgi:polyphosphate kinase
MRLLVAPRHLRKGLLKRIKAEAVNAEAGLPSGIRIKVNSIVDEQIIDSLYRASQAGVPIDLVVRGICGLRPGVPGLSETIRVRSIVGRYLEHSRIFSFVSGGEPQVFIGSADLMHRNLDRRVEALVRLVEPAHLEQVTDIFDLSMSPEIASWSLESSGDWTRNYRNDDGSLRLDLQNVIMQRISERPVTIRAHVGVRR